MAASSRRRNGLSLPAFRTMHAPHVACRKVCLVLCEGVCFWRASLLLGHMRKPFVGPRSELWQRQLEQISCERKVLQF